MNQQNDLRYMPLTHIINTLGVLAVTFALLVAFYYQLFLHELPCPLCLLQRVGFILMGFGFLLNMRFGSSNLHYGMSLIGALAGAIGSARQILLHIVPGTGTYGSDMMGLHFYSWALVGFILCIPIVAILLMLETRRSEPRTAITPTKTTLIVGWLFVAVIAANLLSTTLECGLGACADDPVVYELLE